MKRKTLREQVTDLRLALHFLHAGWKACPWCGKTKPPSAECACSGWRAAKARVPSLISDRRVTP